MPPLTTYLVEDSPVIRDSLSSTLEELAGVRVVGWSADEAGATRWLNGIGPRAELLIVDLFLSTGTGLGVLRAAAALPLAPRRVVLSNFATTEMRRHCLALGAERVFDKSTEIDALIDFCSALAAAAGAVPAR